MLRSMVLGVLLYVVLAIADEVFKEKGTMTVHRGRMYKFALYQDLFIVLNIIKLLVYEGYTISELMQRMREARVMTQLYIASSVVLHSVLLLDEPVDHKLRLNPSPYQPVDLPEGDKELFLL